MLVAPRLAVGIAGTIEQADKVVQPVFVVVKGVAVLAWTPVYPIGLDVSAGPLPLLMIPEELEAEEGKLNRE